MLNVYQRVQNGIKWLNENKPGWDNKIDLDNLDLCCGERCIIGQLYGEFCHNCPSELKLDNYKLSDEYGFSNLGNTYYGDLLDNELTKEWNKQILLIRSGCEVENFLDDIPEVVRMYRREEVIELLKQVMNLGMGVRQNQLNGSETRSGNTILSEFIENNLKVN